MPKFFATNPLGFKVETGELEDLSVTTPKLAAGAVTPAKITLAGTDALGWTGAGTAEISSEDSIKIRIDSNNNQTNRTFTIMKDVSTELLKVGEAGETKITGSIRLIDGNEGANKLLQSDANGVGSWATVATGGDMVLMHAGSGSVVGGTEAEIDTFTMTAADFTANDALHVVILGDGTSGEARVLLRVADGTGTADSTTSFDDITVPYNLHIMQSPESNDFLKGGGYFVASTNINDGQILNEGMAANWITTAFTVSIRGDGNSGTGHWRWWVYKVKG